MRPAVGTLGNSDNALNDKIAKYDENDLGEIKFVCDDVKLRPFWIDLLKEKWLISKLFQSQLQSEYDCSKILKVNEVDLNGDGRPEYSVRFDSILVCSPTANCPMAVYYIDDSDKAQFRSSAGVINFSLKRVLFSIGAMRIEFDEKSTIGFKDASVVVNANPDGLYLERFKYDGNEYHRSRCFEYKDSVIPTRCWDINP